MLILKHDFWFLVLPVESELVIPFITQDLLILLNVCERKHG
jgi:hypothetical protein